MTSEKMLTFSKILRYFKIEKLQNRALKRSAKIIKSRVKIKYKFLKLLRYTIHFILILPFIRSFWRVQRQFWHAKNLLKTGQLIHTTSSKIHQKHGYFYQSKNPHSYYKICSKRYKPPYVWANTTATADCFILKGY